MKKTIAIFLSLFMIFGLAACGNSANPTEQSLASTEANSVESTTNPVVSTENNKTGNMESIKSTEVPESQLEQPETFGLQSESQLKESETSEVQGIKVLVAYFSATNTTEKVAEHIANGLGADLYEIVPENPYTSADLNYHDNNSRTTIEMNDPDARPVIAGSVEHMEQYDIVFIGYPIWWGDAPRIVSTFMESYDFSGKTIVPFCTSGGSGMGSSAANLEQLTSDAIWLSGRRLNGSDSQDIVMEWVNGLDLNLGE